MSKIIIKKRNSVGGEGKKKGSWKIAYSDFVTAMMAFFLVMWLISVSTKDDLDRMSTFFNASPQTKNDNNESTSSKAVQLAQTSAVSLEDFNFETLLVHKNLIKADKQKFQTIINELRSSKSIQEYMQNIYLDVTQQGLRIQIVDSINRPMFEPNTDIMKIYMKEVLLKIIDVINHEGNYFTIAGHTKKSSKKFSNDIWLLSFLRANQVRKFLVSQDISFNQTILRVIGKGDKDPMYLDKPDNEQNIRVEITLLNDRSLDARYKYFPDDLY